MDCRVESGWRFLPVRERPICLVSSAHNVEVCEASRGDRPAVMTSCKRETESEISDRKELSIWVSEESRPVTTQRIAAISFSAADEK